MIENGSYQPASDEELLAAAVRGERAAFDELWMRHEAMLARRLKGRTRNITFSGGADWRDILQDAALTAFQAAHRFEGRGEVGAWLWGIARHKFLDRYRHFRRTLPAGDRWELAQETIEFDEAIARLDRRDGFDRCMAALPENHRQVLLLRIEGCTHDEIASKLEIPVNTAKTWVKRARDNLQRCITEADRSESQETGTASESFG